MKHVYVNGLFDSEHESDEAAEQAVNACIDDLKRKHPRISREELARLCVVKDTDAAEETKEASDDSGGHIEDQALEA